MRKRNLITPKESLCLKPQGMHNLCQGGGTATDGRKGQSKPEPGRSRPQRTGGTGEVIRLCQSLSLPGWGTPLWSKETDPPLKRRERSKTSPKPACYHPCLHARGMTREGEVLAAPDKHHLLSTFICHHLASPSSPSSPSSSSPMPPTATVAGGGLQTGSMVRAPCTHTPKRSLKRSNVD